MFFLICFKIFQYVYFFWYSLRTIFSIRHYRNYLIPNIEFWTTLELSKFPDGYPSWTIVQTNRARRGSNFGD